MLSADLHSIEAEQGALGAILIDNGCLDKVAPILEPEHFYEPLHGEIYTAIKGLSKQGRIFNPTTLGPFFANAGPVREGLSAIQYLGRLAASATTIAGAPAYAQIIREYAERRAVADVGLRLQQLAGDPALGAAQMAAEGVRDLDGIITAATPHGRSKLSLAASVHETLEELRRPERSRPITSGFADLDRVTGGFHRGEYNVIAGRPSMGKTAFATSAMLNAGRAGHGVLMFSLEMTKKAISARCLSDSVWNRDTPIPYADILNRRIGEYHIERLERAALDYERLPIEIEYQPALTVAEIAARSRQEAAALSRRGLELELVIIDHLGKIKASKRYSGNPVAEIGEVSGALAAFGKELNVSMLVLHQLNRAVEGREDKHPQLSDLRWSGDIEQDTDLVAFIYRPGYYLERMKFDDEENELKRVDKLQKRGRDLEIIIAKQRNGPCTTVELFTEISSNVIRCKAKSI